MIFGGGGVIIVFFFFLSFVFCLFRAASTAYGDARARDQIGAVAAILCHSHSHSHSNSRSEPCL